MKAQNHKCTMKCPKCSYTSRIPLTNFFLTNKNSVHSKLCPVHRLELIKFYIPLKKTK